MDLTVGQVQEDIVDGDEFDFLFGFSLNDMVSRWGLL